MALVPNPSSKLLSSCGKKYDYSEYIRFYPLRSKSIKFKGEKEREREGKKKKEWGKKKRKERRGRGDKKREKRGKVIGERSLRFEPVS